MNTRQVEEISSLVRVEFGTLQIAALAFLLGAVIGLAFWFARKGPLGKVSWVVSLIATLVLTVSVVVRYINVGHIPYVRMYETYLFLAWSIAVVAVIADGMLRSRLPTTIGDILVGLTLIYIIQWPEISKEGFSLQPALQSPWLDVHIATCFLSYAGFAISAGASVVYLFKRAPTVDELSYKLVAFAFPLLGLGILTGAVWANEAWGRYWGWDPKETASLVTWLVYAGFIHARMVLGWKGVRASWLNLLGFACVLFTWLGLTVLSTIIQSGSLHVYTA